MKLDFRGKCEQEITLSTAVNHMLHSMHIIHTTVQNLSHWRRCPICFNSSVAARTISDSFSAEYARTPSPTLFQALPLRSDQSRQQCLETKFCTAIYDRARRMYSSCGDRASSHRFTATLFPPPPPPSLKEHRRVIPYCMHNRGSGKQPIRHLHIM